MTLKADRSYSIQDQFTKSDNYFVVFGTSFDGFLNWAGRVPGVPPYLDSRRDKFLSSFWKEEPILAGALNTIVKRMKSPGYNIEGGRTNAVKWARKLQAANDGRGWQDFITRWVMDYMTTDLGAIFEMGIDAEGRVQKIYNVDSLKCFPFRDLDYPMVYAQPP